MCILTNGNTSYDVIEFYKNPEKYISAVRMMELTQYFSNIESSFNLSLRR